MMNEISALIKKIEAKIEDLERKRTRLQDDLGQVRRTEKIRLRYFADPDDYEKEADDNEPEPRSDGRELERLREKMNADHQ